MTTAPPPPIIPDLIIWLGMQANHAGFMLSRDPGFQAILTMPRGSFGRVMIGDPLGRAPRPLQYDAKYLMTMCMIRPDFQEYVDDLRACFQDVTTATGERPGVYLAGFHDSAYWSDAVHHGRIVPIVRAITRPFFGDDTSSVPLVGPAVIDGSAFAEAGSSHEIGATMTEACKLPTHCEGRANPGTLFLFMPHREQYTLDSTEKAGPDTLLPNACGTSLHTILVNGAPDPSAIARWRSRGYRLMLPNTAWVNGALRPEWVDALAKPAPPPEGTDNA